MKQPCATGAITGSRTYAPFGEVSEEDGTTGSLGYQGEYTDPETGRVNMHARWYDPATGGFSSRDSWTLNPVPSVQANRYTYANGSPLNFTDPSGHAVICPPKTPCIVNPPKPVPAPKVVRYVKKGAFAVGRGAIRAGIRIIGGALGGVILDDIIFAEHLADGTCGGPCNWIPPTPWQPPGWGMGGVGVRAGKGFCRSCYGVKPPWGANPEGGGYYWDGDGGGGVGVADPPPPPPWKVILAAVLAIEHARPVTEAVTDFELDQFFDESFTLSQKELEADEPYVPGLPSIAADYNESLYVTPTSRFEMPADQDTLLRRQDCSKGASMVHYLPLDEHGRAQGASACLNRGDYNYVNEEGNWAFDTDFTEIVGTSAEYPINWEHIPQGCRGRSGLHRGHLIGRQLGGDGNDFRNLVPLYAYANTPTMRDYENAIAARVQSGETIYYQVVPRYTGDNPIPDSVTLQWSGNVQGAGSVRIRNLP